MNRCLFHFPVALRRSSLNACVAWALTSFLSTAALAQSNPGLDAYFRPFPHNALRGVVRVVRPPEILLNGKADLLSPGSRIRDTENRIVMSQQLVGQDLAVNYTREAAGGVHDVWILTPAELAQPRTSGQ